LLSAAQQDRALADGCNDLTINQEAFQSLIRDRKASDSKPK